MDMNWDLFECGFWYNFECGNSHQRTWHCFSTVPWSGHSHPWPRHCCPMVLGKSGKRDSSTKQIELNWPVNCYALDIIGHLCHKVEALHLNINILVLKYSWECYKLFKNATVFYAGLAIQNSRFCIKFRPVLRKLHFPLRVWHFFVIFGDHLLGPWVLGTAAK